MSGADHRADLHHPPDPQHLPARVEAGLGRAQTRREADLHRGQRSRGPGHVRPARRGPGHPLPGCDQAWDNAWQEFIPFLDYHLEIRRVLCGTNAIEPLNAHYRPAIKARGHFPSEQAALNCLYLVTRSLVPTGRGRARRAMRWKPALNAFSITFADRLPAAETY
jgi:hypothetical protein